VRRLPCPFDGDCSAGRLYRCVWRARSRHPHTHVTCERRIDAKASSEDAVVASKLTDVSMKIQLQTMVNFYEGTEKKFVWLTSGTATTSPPGRFPHMYQSTSSGRSSMSACMVRIFFPFFAPLAYRTVAYLAHALPSIGSNISTSFAGKKDGAGWMPSPSTKLSSSQIWFHSARLQRSSMERGYSLLALMAISNEGVLVRF